MPFVRRSSLRHSRAGRAALLLGLLLAAALLPTAAAAFSSELSTADGRLTVTGAGDFALSGMMPGDRAPAQTITLRASGAVRYAIRVEASGSAALTEALQLRLERADGSLIYEGSLADAAAAQAAWPTATDATLRDGESATILASVALPLSAGSEVQGTSVRASIVIVSMAATGA